MFEIILGFLMILLSWHVLRWYRSAEQDKEELRDEIRKIFIVMTVEHHHDGVFAYNARNGEYLAHGLTFKEMTENFKSRFPDKKGLIVGNNDNIEQIG